MSILPVLLAIAAPPLSHDIPAGADVIARIELGMLRQPLRQLWQDVGAVLPVDKGSREAFGQLVTRLGDQAADIERLTGADLERRGVSLTFAADLDAEGDAVVSAIVRGAFHRSRQPRLEPEDAAVQQLTLDGHRAYRLPAADLVWAYVDGDIVLGDERGLQRQLRQRLSRKPSDNPLVRTAATLRRHTPVMVAFALPARTRQTLGRRLVDFGVLIERVDSGTIAGRPGGADLRLVSGTPKDQQAVAHATSALAALVRAGAAALESSAELLTALDTLGASSTLLPPRLAPEDITPLLDGGLREFILDARVRQRNRTATEVSLRVSSYRAVAAVALLLAGMVEVEPAVEGGPDDDIQRLLLALREAQRAYREMHGTYLACPPSPRRVPTSPTEFPARSCFARLGYVPQRPVGFQIESVVRQGKLLLVARSDPDGDGVPRVWYLDETAERVRGFGAP